MPSLKKRYRQLYFSPCSFDIGGYLLRRMHAAARAKTPGTRRAKPAANPWQALPRLADLFDSQTPQPFFKGSKVSALEESALTETQLLEQTAALLGVSLAKLATRAVTGYPTALRWLKIHHPELLVSKPDEASVAPVAVAPAPEPKPTPPETVKRLPDPTPKKRGTAKASAKMLPKPLRNPKIHPELLADDAHAKTAHKQPEAAPGDHDTAKAQKRAKRLRDPVKEPF